MKPELHNGEVWAKAEASRKEALRRAHTNIEMVSERCEPWRSLGQIAYEAYAARSHQVHNTPCVPWARLYTYHQDAWACAATAVRRAVGR